MGQAAVDLPDPLETPPSASKASTDDLLAQLAGDEIDRLMRDADEERPARAVPPPAGPPAALYAPGRRPQPLPAGVVTPRPTAPPAHPAADPTHEPAPAAGSSPAGEPSAPAPVAPDFGGELDALFARLNTEPTPAAAEALPAPSPGDDSELAAEATLGLLPKIKDYSPADAFPAPRAQDPAPPPSLDETPTSAAERAGLDTAGVAAAITAAPAAQAATGQDEDDGLPVYLRPLEWLNAPLAACPEFVREFVGKAAIVTLVNALAVLIYVVLFRRN